MRLVSRHLPPTPANYQECYNEIAGLPNLPAFPEGPMRDLARQLESRSDDQAAALDELGQAIARRSWQGVAEALKAYATSSSQVVSREPIIQVVEAGLPEEFPGKLARFVESVLPALGEEDSRVLGLARELVALLKQPGVEWSAVQSVLANLTHQALFVAEEQAEIKESLLKLLNLIIRNIAELSVDDRWLQGQLEGLLVSVAPPLNLRHLDEMERRLLDVMEKQGRAKARSVEAQAEMRQMLAEFIASLTQMNQSSQAFEGRIEESARQIEQVERIEDLRPLLRDVVAATRAMADETSRSREQLQTLQEKVAVTEAELVQLHQELDNASALARHDPLTDALNRKGLDEALVREIATMRRKDTPLSVCLLDIDNFKKLNDQHGHEAGDRALIHLANVARRSMRPSDTLARYGGEEFVILMPDTVLEQGIEAMTRLQRELTKTLYLTGSERILITFSAGVAQLSAEESGADAIRRADKAMYLAKRAGKNRVFGA